MKPGIWCGLVSALLALILLIPANMALAQDSGPLVANPSEMYVTLYPKQSTIRTIEIYNRGNETISGYIEPNIRCYCINCGVDVLLENANFSISPGEKKKVNIRVWGFENPEQYPEFNITIIFVNETERYDLCVVHIITVEPPDYALYIIPITVIAFVGVMTYFFILKKRGGKSLVKKIIKRK